MMKTKPVATTLLVVMAIIFLIAYPQRQDMFWAFIMHVSGAAMIGGLADWYAVTALFTKPLGIPFKTAILPRSKERLIQIGRTMLSEELLRVPQMYYAIKKERVMVRIIEYGMSDVGQGQIRDILYGVGNQVLSHMDIEPMRQEINKAIYKGVTNWKATPLVILFGRCMLERQTASIFWLYFIESGVPLFVSRHARHYENLYEGFLLPRTGYCLWRRWAFTRTIGRNGTEKGCSIPKG